MGELGPGRLLYVEDDSGMRRALLRVLASYRYTVCEAASLQQARRLVSQGNGWCGFIADHGLPDGLGLGLLEALRERYPRVPRLLATGQLDHGLANACARSGVMYVVKPFGLPELELFFEHVARYDARRGAVEQGIVALADQARLTTREHEVLRLSIVRGYGHQQLADEFGISRHTVKTHVRRVLQKSGAESMAVLRARFRAEDRK